MVTKHPQKEIFTFCSKESQLRIQPGIDVRFLV